MLELYIPSLISAIAAGLLLLIRGSIRTDYIKRGLLWVSLFFLLGSVMQAISISPGGISVNEVANTSVANITNTTTTYSVSDWDTVWKIGFAEAFTLIMVFMLMMADFVKYIIDSLRRMIKI